MKSKLTTIIFCFLFAFANAQTSADLDINNIKARINSGGDLFWDFNSAKFEAPKGSGINSIFAGNLWIAGVDAGNQVHAACQTYRQNGVDFWPGPMDTINVSCPSAVYSSPTWNRVWKVNKTTVDSFVLGLFGTNIPLSISSWPGNGDANYNQAKKLAPFYDVNNDGIYNPTQGDYPLIQGDQAIYFIYNDVASGHGETGLS